MIDSYCLIDALGCNVWSYPHINRTNISVQVSCWIVFWEMSSNVWILRPPTVLEKSTLQLIQQLPTGLGLLDVGRCFHDELPAWHVMRRWTRLESKLGQLGPKIQNHLTRKFSKLFFCRCWRTTWSRLWCCRSGGISRNVRHSPHHHWFAPTQLPACCILN